MSKRFVSLFLSVFLVAQISFGALKFDGTAFPYIYQSPKLAVNQSAGTICFWFKLDDAYSNGQFFFRCDVGTAVLDFIIFTDGNWFTGWYCSGCGGDDRVITSASSIATSRWYHAALTWTSGGATTLYIDGTSIGSVGTTDATWDTSAATNNYIGAIYGTPRFNGVIDDFRIYNRVITTSELSSLASSRSRLTITDGLMQWLPMDDCVDGQLAAISRPARDISGNGIHMVSDVAPAAPPVCQASSGINYP